MSALSMCIIGGSVLVWFVLVCVGLFCFVRGGGLEEDDEHDMEESDD